MINSRVGTKCMTLGTLDLGGHGIKVTQDFQSTVTQQPPNTAALLNEEYVAPCFRPTLSKL